ncbi:TVP38/TMEM64 family protein [Halohasta litorea]|uniref:TVP38/TMEM64 family protein n=1 Tax=Halohasta litorea TaxID=869891 RepID=A0ABD6D5K5_9EURY|nr:VTT domain-containing protein [Halohasta litorea]
MQRRTRLAVGGVTLLGVGLAAWVVSPAVALARFEALASNPLLFAAVILVVALVRPACAWPTLVLSTGIGFAYGLSGLPLALGALVLTSLPPYWFGASTAGSGRLTTAGQTLLAETGGVRGVTAARLLPLPSDVISAGAGAIHVRLPPYLVGTALGELPWAVLGLTVGRSVDHLTTGELSGAVDPWLVAGMTATAVLLLAGPCYRLASARWSLKLPAAE